MVQSVELLLDDGLDARVREQWRALGEAGLPNLGRHSGPTNRPHVTLGVAEGVSPADDERLVRAVADVPALPLPVLLGGFVVLGVHRHVLARLVVPSADLLRLQAAVAEAWRGALHVPQTVVPGSWTPHVTLAKHLSDTQVGQALTALRTMPADGHDGHGEGVAVRRWDGEARVAWDLGLD